MKHLHLRQLATFTVALLLGACTATRSPDTLEIFLADVRFTDATAFETAGVFVICVQNQSPEALQCNGAVHKVTLNGIRVGSGVQKERLALERLSDGKQTVTVRFAQPRARPPPARPHSNQTRELAARKHALPASRHADLDREVVAHGSAGPEGVSNAATDCPLNAMRESEIRIRVKSRNRDGLSSPNLNPARPISAS